NQPYIPQLPNRSSVFQTPKLHQPDLKGRVFYRSNGMPVHNAMIKFWDVLSGKSYTATTNYNGEFEINFIQKNLTGQIQATKGADTSAIREVRIKADKSALIDLTIMDKPSVQQPQTQWPANKQASPPRNSIWQFN
ncbi:MAG: carboxypeptidase regulatory-like domain-containing protein, partial [Candidatus Electrothrix sp. ATG1]|nr:carboxypeptidase regulatory-like domain-containing protein [Candidatus Electrothrix sp. ATG1]